MPRLSTTLLAVAAPLATAIAQTVAPPTAATSSDPNQETLVLSTVGRVSDHDR